MVRILRVPYDILDEALENSRRTGTDAFGQALEDGGSAGRVAYRGHWS